MWGTRLIISENLCILIFLNIIDILMHQKLLLKLL